MNLGDDAELTAPSMTLNSTGNFFNDGKVTIAGETSVTQARIYWVNAGHYTTGTMTFSAKNATFYNYCQLIVTGNAHMYDGEFNLMNNSYTEAATAEFDNFIVNMGSNSGINIKGTTNWAAQGDGTYQGFKVFEGASGSYVRLGGKATVASHKKTLSISSGITYYIPELEIIKNGSPVTEEYLLSINDGDYPVLELNGTEADDLTVTPNTNSCGATWTIGGDEIETIRVVAEDLTVGDRNTDFDFNDVVFDVIWNKTQNTVSIEVLADGAELTMYIGGTAAGVSERMNVNEMFSEANGVTIPKSVYPNTAAGAHYAYKTYKFDLNSDEWSGTDIGSIARSIYVRVMKSGQLVTLEAPVGKAAGKIAVGDDYDWCDERQDITDKYGNKFKEYVGGQHTYNTWYK